MSFFVRARPLTDGELALLQPVFRDALNYQKIRVYPRRYLPFQAALIAMSPNGAMFFPRDTLYCDDFSCTSYRYITLFIHEAVHIWQHQMGFPVRLSGLCIALKGGYKKQKAYQYKHLLEKYQRFSQFNMEQQAEIITDYFVAQYFYQQPLTELHPILQDFLDNPKNKKLLPENICFQAA